MKRILSLVLAVVMVAVLFCGCSTEYSAKVSKNGKTKITVKVAIPVETIEEMKNFDTSVDDSEQVEDFDSEDYLDEDYSMDDMYGDYDMEDLEDMEVEVIDGVEYYVEKETESFSSTKKANKHMIEVYGKDAAGVFKKFNVTTKDFTATVMSSLSESAKLLGDDYKYTLKITLPYIITKTNGNLSDDKKTVEFDLLEANKLYAHTTKSDKTAKIYFKKDYLKSNSSVYLSWNKVKGAKNYKVEYKVTGGKKWSSLTTKKTSAIIKKLKEGKDYSFKVTAITKSKKHTSIITKETTLKKVSAVVKSKTKTTVNLSWKKNINADGYRIYQKASKSDNWKKIKTIKDPYTTKYTVKKLKSNKTYYFKVVSYIRENGKMIRSAGEAVKTKTKK